MKRLDVNYAKGNIFEDLVRLLERRKRIREQRTFCWCPVCNDDLCSNNSFNPDSGSRYVRYDCTNCGASSVWDFDVPTPVLLSTAFSHELREKDNQTLSSLN